MLIEHTIRNQPVKRIPKLSQSKRRVNSPSPISKNVVLQSNPLFPAMNMLVNAIKTVDQGVHLSMSFVMAVHVLTGTAIVCSGATALLLSKGSSQHKLAGRLFVGLELLMGLVVAAGAWSAPGSISPLGMLFVCFIIYLVVSAWSTIRRSERLLAPLDIVAPVVALCISITGLLMGFDAYGNQSVGEDIPPKEAYFFFAALV
jgi:uncharacterized membrane protein